MHYLEHAGDFAVGGLYGVGYDHMTHAMLSWGTLEFPITSVTMQPALFARLIQSVESRFNQPCPVPLTILGARMDWDQEAPQGTMRFYAGTELVGEIRGWF